MIICYHLRVLHSALSKGPLQWRLYRCLWLGISSINLPLARFTFPSLWFLSFTRCALFSFDARQICILITFDHGRHIWRVVHEELWDYSATVHRFEIVFALTRFRLFSGGDRLEFVRVNVRIDCSKIVIRDFTWDYHVFNRCQTTFRKLLLTLFQWIHECDKNMRRLIPFSLLACTLCKLPFVPLLQHSWVLFDFQLFFILSLFLHVSRLALLRRKEVFASRLINILLFHVKVQGLPLRPILYVFKNHRACVSLWCWSSSCGRLVNIESVLGRFADLQRICCHLLCRFVVFGIYLRFFIFNWALINLFYCYLRVLCRGFFFSNDRNFNLSLIARLTCRPVNA